MLIESANDFTKRSLIKIASQLSKKVLQVDSADRKALHVSAVFACNLTNHLFTIAGKLLADKQLDFDLLKPLITETINKSLEIGSQNAQTGPAVRNDLVILENHMEYLADKPDYKEIYRLITQNIMDSYPDS